METYILEVEELVSLVEYNLSENIVIQNFNFTTGSLVVDMTFLMRCPICQDSCTTEVSRLECGHLFHKNCVIKWLEVADTKLCPVCRAVVRGKH